MPQTLSDIIGAPIDTVFQKITDVGISPVEAASFLGTWLASRSIDTQRLFNYITPFPDTEASCDVAFQRTLQHQDWVDGESVVQAGETPTETGFNRRFHAVEGDLDSLGRGIAQLSLCLMQMRKDLAALLTEIRTEINRINADLYQIRKATAPITSGVLTAAGAAKTFVGAGKFNNVDASLWQSDTGIVVLPPVTEIRSSDVTNHRLITVGGLAKTVTDNNEIVSFFERNPITKKNLADHFGSVPLPAGGTLGSVTAILPDSVVYPSLDAMVSAVVDRQAAAVRTSNVESADVLNGLSVSTTGDTGSVPLSRLSVIPGASRSALEARGITSVAALASSDRGQLASALTGSNVTTGDIASWIAIARTINALQ